MAGDGNELVSFTAKDAARVGAATKQVERMSQGGDRAGPGGGPPGIALRYARASSSITARSSSTLGSGTANLASRSGAALTEGAVSVEVYNDSDLVVADDSWLVVGWVQGGWEVLKVGGCANLS